MKNLILFIESNTSGTGRLFIRKSLEIGFTPILVSERPEKYSFETEFPDLLIYNCNTMNINNVMETVKEIANIGRIKGVLSSSEYFIEMAAEVAKKIGTPHNDINTIKLCRNKYALRNYMYENQINTPKYLLVRSFKELLIFRKKVNFPVVVKPVQGSGSVDVKKCNNWLQLINQVYKILQKVKNERGIEQIPEVLIEEYVIGEEYSSEIFNGKIIGITKKYLGAEPYFVEIGHDFPANLKEYEQGIILDKINNFICKFNLKFGAYHLEFRVKNNDVYIIEINPRLAGGYIPVLVEKSLGIDLIKKSILNAIGFEDDSIQSNELSKIFASIRFIVPDKIGEVDSIYLPKNLDWAKLQILMYKKTPLVISHIYGDFRDRVGHILLVGENPVTVKTDADNLINKIDFSYKPKLITLPFF